MNPMVKGIIGAWIGSLIAGPIGAALGVFIGMSFGDGRPRISSSAHRKQGTERGQFKDGGSESPDGTLYPIFRCLGKLAKSDGRVSEDEAAFVRSLMKSWHFDRDTSFRMDREFRNGRDSTEPFGVHIRALADQLKMIGASYDVRCAILQLFCSLVVADHAVHVEERRMLNEAGRAFGAEDYVRNFFAGYHAEDNTAADDAQELTLAQCYELLGISPAATDAQVKSAFRRKAKQFHPDFAEGAGLSAAGIQRAKTMFQKINAAYEAICMARGMK